MGWLSDYKGCCAGAEPRKPSQGEHQTCFQEAHSRPHRGPLLAKMKEEESSGGREYFQTPLHRADGRGVSCKHTPTAAKSQSGGGVASLCNHWFWLYGMMKEEGGGLWCTNPFECAVTLILRAVNGHTVRGGMVCALCVVWMWVWVSRGGPPSPGGCMSWPLLLGGWEGDRAANGEMMPPPPATPALPSRNKAEPAP